MWLRPLLQAFMRVITFSYFICYFVCIQAFMWVITFSFFMHRNMQPHELSSRTLLGSIIQKNGRINEDIVHRIKAGQVRCKLILGVLLCNKKCQQGQKENPSKLVTSVMLYETESWSPTREHACKLLVAKMCMLRWMYKKTCKDLIRNGR